MHMTDALLSPAAGGAMYAVSAAAVGLSIHKMKKNDEINNINGGTNSGFNEKQLPLMAVSGAFVFAAQMINFTIPGTGSSGHIGGGMLLAGMLGGCPALLTIAAVLTIQCLFFADGGLLALGANIFNIGVIPCIIVYPLIFKPMMKWAANNINNKSFTTTNAGSTGQHAFSVPRMTAAAVVSSAVGLQLGSLFVVLETAASGITELPIGAFLLMMQPIHLVIGIIEGIITAGIFAYVNSSRPEILRSALGENTSGSKETDGNGSGIKRTVCVLAVMALLTGGCLSLFASGNPDGLEWSIEKITGTAELQKSDSAHDKAQALQDKTSIMPDYDFKSDDSADSDGKISGTSASGIIGAAMTCALAAAAGGIITFIKRQNRRKKKK